MELDLRQAVVELERRFGMAEGELTGTYNGAPTEAKRQFDAQFGLAQQQFGLSEAGVTGMYQGQQTQAARLGAASTVVVGPESAVLRRPGQADEPLALADIVGRLSA